MSGKLRPDTSIREIREQARILGIDDNEIMSTKGIEALKAAVAFKLKWQAEVEEAEED